MGSPANIDYTIAAYPMSAPLCQHTPLSLNNFTIKCEGDDTILEIFGAGITYPSKKRPDQNNICMFSDEVKEKMKYTKSSRFNCDKQLRKDLVPYLNKQFYGKKAIKIEDFNDLFKEVMFP